VLIAQPANINLIEAETPHPPAGGEALQRKAGASFNSSKIFSFQNSNAVNK